MQDNDLISLLIYVALGLVGVIASAYKNKMKKQQSNSVPRVPGAPHDIPANPGRGFGPELGPDLGPLMDLFDIPKKEPEPAQYETIEQGPSVEEGGMNVDTEEASAELGGINEDIRVSELDKPVSEFDKPILSDVESFEEGQSDIQKMIAKYEAIRKELDPEGPLDDIARGEIVSVEAEEAAREKSDKKERYFNPRKAIIYSEILKRKEY